MATSLPWLMQGDNIVIMIESRQHTINKETHPNYGRILDAIRAGDWEAVPDLVDISRAVASYANGLVEVIDGDVYYDGRPFHNAVADRLLNMLQEGLPVDALVNFLGNLKQNPSKRAVDELYGFLEKNALPLTPDGHFLAYKKVRSDFKDIHSGTFDNSIGQVVEMPRNEVDEDAQRTCSSGLHFCSLEYLPHFSGGSNDNVVIVKINPADVVSIPVDYNNAKGRACRYEVVGLHGAANPDTTEAFDSSVVSPKPRAVRLDTGWGRDDFYYVDNGQPATREAYEAYQDYRREQGWI